MDPAKDDLGSWSLESLEARMAGVHREHESEQIRLVAQAHVCSSALPRDARLRWAALALAANRRFPGQGPREEARARSQEFALRTWVVEHIGTDGERDWNPEALATDTLAALRLAPYRAESLAAGWRGLPVEQIAELRRHKNMTAHLDRLMPVLLPGPVKERIARWVSVRRFLP
jgi:hypothetical protein